MGDAEFNIGVHHMCEPEAKILVVGILCGGGQKLLQRVSSKYVSHQVFVHKESRVIPTAYSKGNV